MTAVANLLGDQFLGLAIGFDGPEDVPSDHRQSILDAMEESLGIRVRDAAKVATGIGCYAFYHHGTYPFVFSSRDIEDASDEIDRAWIRAWEDLAE